MSHNLWVIIYETEIMSYLYESYYEWIEHKGQRELASKCRRLFLVTKWHNRMTLRISCLQLSLSIMSPLFCHLQNLLLQDTLTVSYLRWTEFSKREWVDVSDISGSSLCWWQVRDVGDRFSTLKNHHYSKVQPSYSATNIFKLSSSLCNQHHYVTDINVTKIWISNYSQIIRSFLSEQTYVPEKRVTLEWDEGKMGVKWRWNEDEMGVI